MGYRSDVRIVTSKRGYNELKKSIQDYYKENDIPKDYQFDLLNNTNDSTCLNLSEINSTIYFNEVYNILNCYNNNNYNYRIPRNYCTPSLPENGGVQ